MRIILVLSLFVASCAHQDLKAPYHEGEYQAVLDQWDRDEHVGKKPNQ